MGFNDSDIDPKEQPVRGPFWNDKTGVTGEPKFRTQEPNYVTTTDEDGNIRTLTGAAADAFREVGHDPTL